MTMTRGEFAQRLAELFDLEAPLGLTSEFIDTSGTPYDAAVADLAQEGITRGVGGGRFDPNRQITRGEAATMLARAMRLGPSNANRFTDVASTSPFASAINALADAGIIMGVGNNRFNPSGAFTADAFDIVADRVQNRPTVRLAPAHVPGPGEEPPLAEPIRDALERARHWLTTTFDVPSSDAVMEFLERAYHEGWSQAELEIEMYKETWFQERFPGLFIDGGGVGGAVSPQDYLDLEDAFRSVLRSAGAPVEMWDTPDDFGEWIAAGVSPLEVSDRLRAGFEWAQAAPDEVREFFARAYGPFGDAALAAWALADDQERAVADLERAVRAAQIGGTAARFGVRLDVSRAERLAEIGVTDQAALRGFAELDAMRSLFDEGIGEDRDLTLEGEGIDAVFGVGGFGARLLEQRRRSRLARLTGSGGAAGSEQGVFGLGSAS